MSRERQRAREAREAERAAERERLARERARRTARQQRLQRLRPTRPERRPRPRRYGATPTRVKLALGLGWLFVQFVVWQLVPEARGRIGFAVATLIALPLAVVVVPWPSSWKAR